MYLSFLLYLLEAVAEAAVEQLQLTPEPVAEVVEL
jgi:hypothetical protein